MHKVLLGAVTAAALLVTAPAHAAPAPTTGRITGVVSSSSEARQVPCPVAGTATATGREHVGVACFPKKSRRWTVDQGPDGCTLKSDVTTGFRMMGDCVLTIDEGAHVKVWAPPSAVSEEFRVVWR